MSPFSSYVLRLRSEHSHLHPVSKHLSLQYMTTFVTNTVDQTSINHPLSQHLPVEFSREQTVATVSVWHTAANTDEVKQGQLPAGKTIPLWEHLSVVLQPRKQHMAPSWFLQSMIHEGCSIMVKIHLFFMHRLCVLHPCCLVTYLYNMATRCTQYIWILCVNCL